MKIIHVLILKCLMTTFVVLAPLVILFDIGGVFYTDWTNHLWMIAYFGEYFKTHFYFPDVFNTNEVVGIVYPPFYSALFYQMIGLISIFTGANLAIRIAIGLLFFLQFVVLLQLIRKISNNYWLAFAISTLYLWSIYPLTNLYNRSALTELFAVSLLTVAVCLWLYSFKTEKTNQKIVYRILFSVFFSISFCFHPITAIFGSLFVISIIFFTIPALYKEKMLKMNIMLGGILFTYISLVCLPWVYIALKFKDGMSISARPNIDYIRGIDQFWVRISPLPLDMRSIVGDIKSVSTPYLDAQLNMPLLILAVVILFYIVREQIQSKALFAMNKNDLMVLGMSIIAFIFFFVSSLYRPIFSLLPKEFFIVQFAYRLVSYQNLSLLVSIVFCLSIIYKTMMYDKIKQRLFQCFIIILTISSLGIVYKQIHASSIMLHEPLSSIYKNELLTLPKTMYGTYAYVSTTTFNKTEEIDESTLVNVNIPTEKENKFGEPKSVRVSFPEPTYAVLNVYPFEWNRIYVDGVQLSGSDIFWVNSKLSVKLSSGAHNISTKFIPDSLWKTYKSISYLLLSTGIIFCLYIAVKLILYKRKLWAYNPHNSNRRQQNESSHLQQNQQRRTEQILRR